MYFINSWLLDNCIIRKTPIVHIYIPKPCDIFYVLRTNKEVQHTQKINMIQIPGKIFTAAILIVLFFTSEAQNIAGTWKGSLEVQGNQIPVVFHVKRDSTHQWIAAFDSPSQQAFNLSCSDVIVKNDSVIFMMAILNGKYAGILNRDQFQITGTGFQGGGSLPLTINKISDTATVLEHKRPQTPRPPFAYHSEEVIYSNADHSIQFGGTLTYPNPDSLKGSSDLHTFPAVILITGSGQQDRDETLFGHKPFAVIADYLTKRDFVVLRVDDRGMGKTTGIFSEANSMDFAKDVEAGLNFLEQQPMVDKNKIGLIGHSEGGLIAPIVADERGEIKFIILLAGPGIPIIDLMEQQTEAVSISIGESPAKARANGQLMHIVWEELIKNEDSATTVQHIRMKIDSWSKTLDTVTLAKMKSGNSNSIDKQITLAMAALNNRWYKYFMSFNPQPYLEKLNCKVLALNGSKDVQVIAATNLKGIQESLKKSKSPKYNVIEIPGLNHLFQTCIQCNPAEYNDLEESFSPAALDIMGNWLKENVQR
jgi:pimeloyl-ACP methyl ester carboxylesterase